MFICVFLTSKKAPKFIHLPNSNNRDFDTIILLNLKELRWYTCPYAEKRKKNAEMQTYDGKGQWKGHHRVPQDTQVPKGSHDYVLRFPNAEHQKKNVWRWLKIKVKPCLNFRLYCALGFCLELDVKSLRIVWIKRSFCLVWIDITLRTILFDLFLDAVKIPLKRLKVLADRDRSEKQKYLNLSY